MIHLPEPLPLPTSDVYARITLGVEEDVVIDKENAMRQLVLVTERDYAMRVFANKSLRLANIVEPMDRFTEQPVDVNRMATRAFYLGSIAGALIGERAHGNVYQPDRLLDNTRLIDYSTSDDTFHESHASAEAIMEFGHNGYESIGDEAKDRIEKWSEWVVPSVTNQRYFTLGAGLITAVSFGVHNMYINAYERREMEILAETIENSDSDDIFAKLLSGE